LYLTYERTRGKRERQKPGRMQYQKEDLNPLLGGSVQIRQAATELFVVQNGEHGRRDALKILLHPTDLF